jgi:membrane-associated phospholipid phosphatase
LAHVQELKDISRTFNRIARAFYWETPEGRAMWGLVKASQWMLEDHWETNPPRAARAFALLAVSYFDAFIASQDGKYSYWYIRPPQLDAGIVPLFAIPNHPSYPANHATLSTSTGEILAYLFPERADTARAIGAEAGDARMWAGIHYRMDVEAGRNLGRAVAGKVIAWAQADGSE